jgi:ABC-type uncharacterized transport system substrate-binding protein
VNNRRKLVIALGAGALLMLLAETSQPQSNVHRIGMLLAGTPATTKEIIEAFTQGLRELGYVEGKNIVIDKRFADGNVDRLPALAVDLTQQKVEVILAAGTAAAKAAKRATTTVPVVMANSVDPVGNGFVDSLARPGGNMTGISNMGQEVSAKRMELLKEVSPKISRIAVAVSPSDPTHAPQFAEIQRAAKVLGLKIVAIQLRSRDDFEHASALVRKARADAMVCIESSENFANRKLVAEFAAKLRLPAIYGTKGYAEAGGLISYGSNYEINYHRAATYVDKILRGAKPSDLPVEQPTKFELIINAKTAKALGIKIPNSILVRADKVIE